MQRVLSTLLFVASSCHSPPAPPKDSTPEPRATASSSAAAPIASARATVSAGAHACGSDADCMNSCAHGAVNRAWWEKSYPGGEACEDGCASKFSETPRCEAGSCIAYARGKRDEHCTQKEVPVPPGPGPAHRCQADADCRMSCRYGAVSSSWYSWGASNECKDGCEEGRSARCQSGTCVAFRGTERDAECSSRSIHQK